jgi:excisionase family DNA binding protein
MIGEEVKSEKPTGPLPSTEEAAGVGEEPIRDRPVHLKPALSVADIAREMNCSPTHVLNLIHGKIADAPPLPAVRTGRLYRIRRITFDRWLEQCESVQLG